MTTNNTAQTAQTNAKPARGATAAAKSAPVDKSAKVAKVARVDTAEDTALADFLADTFNKGFKVAGKVDAGQLGRKSAASFIATLGAANKGRKIVGE